MSHNDDWMKAEQEEHRALVADLARLREENEVLKARLVGHECAGGPNECGSCCTCLDMQAHYALDAEREENKRLEECLKATNELVSDRVERIAELKEALDYQRIRYRELAKSIGISDEDAKNWSVNNYDFGVALVKEIERLRADSHQWRKVAGNAENGCCIHGDGYPTISECAVDRPCFVCQNNSKIKKLYEENDKLKAALREADGYVRDQKLLDRITYLLADDRALLDNKP